MKRNNQWGFGKLIVAAILFSIIATTGCFAPTKDPRLSLGLDVKIEGVRESGEPAVIFESGSFGIPILDVAQFFWISPGITGAIAQRTMTVAYNRAGVASSDSTTAPRDAQTIVGELRTMLFELEIEPPYILVGHSLGGYYNHYFARNYPDEVLGLVLVDPTQFEAFSSCMEWFGEDYLGMCEYYKTEKILEVYSDLGVPEALWAETALMDLGYQQIIDSPPLQQMPFTLISASKTNLPDNLSPAQWESYYPGTVQLSNEEILAWAHNNHQQQLSQVTGGTHVIASDTYHSNITFERPQDIIGAINDVLADLGW